MLRAHGEWIAHGVLRLRRGSARARYVVLAVAFAISAADHWAAAYAANPAHAYWGTLAFFCVQPLGIAVETAVASIAGGRAGGVGVWVGRVWVVLWFAGTAGWFFEDLEKSGVSDIQGTFTLCGRLLGRGWWIE